VIGSIVTALMQGSRERVAELRAYRLDAADSFATCTLQAVTKARLAAGEVLRDRAVPIVDPGTGDMRPEIRAALDAASQAVDDVVAQQARVHLLFGSQSPAGKSATGIGESLRLINGALDHEPDSIRDYDEFRAYSVAWKRTHEGHQEFAEAAFAAIQETRSRWWRRRHSP
jgi:hypothetical protein